MVWASAKAVAFGRSLYWLPQRLRLEVASCECQAHNSHSTKNNENDVPHGVISFLNSSICHWNPLLLCVGRFGYQHCTALSFPAFFTDHPLLYVRPAIEELDISFLQAFRNRTISTSTSVT